MPQSFVIAWFACLLAVTGSTSVRAEETGPAKDVPELQVLQNYHGVWDVVMTGSQIKNEVTARWILGGRFLEQTGLIRSENGPDIEVTTLFTFDTQAKKYRSWTFVSNGSANGSASQAEMTWDANAKTMTSVTQPDANGVRAKVTADFSTPGKERWKFLYTDRSGQQVGEMSGENTRRNNREPKATK